jgi:serine/threonine protein kinase
LRDRLVPVKPSRTERRAVSADRRRSTPYYRGTSSSLPSQIPSASAPEVLDIDSRSFSIKDEKTDTSTAEIVELADLNDGEAPPPPTEINAPSDTGDASWELDLEWQWILNLSMTYRDLSEREKFFITYTEVPGGKRRRLTVSCDYRDAPKTSLEYELRQERHQADKSAKIYDAIRESLPDIMFYDTVTNLKLDSSHDGRLHIHVTEDMHEVIPYPPLSTIRHLQVPHFSETRLTFERHLAGYVYKVRVDSQVYVLKEIPGPDTVDEFWYEINALSQLSGSRSVIQFGGLVVDERRKVVKGLLISFAEQGAMVDILYESKGQLAWARRERWAMQIVRGLSEVHEGGYVQGDFTLSNIVVDDKDNAKIIDINRRGCPVGWEPPEVSCLIGTGQRIGMYIGVKSDIFQLGMVLWAIAEQDDQPEGAERPLSEKQMAQDVPPYFRDLIRICLSDKPRDRLSAKELLTRFPTIAEDESVPLIPARGPCHGSPEKQYIDPAAAVERQDLDRFREMQEGQQNTSDHTYLNNDLAGDAQLKCDLDTAYPPPPNSVPMSVGGLNGLALTSPASLWSPGDDSELGAYIIPVSPSDDKGWEEIEVDRNGHIIQKEEPVEAEPNVPMEDEASPPSEPPKAAERQSAEDCILPESHSNSAATVPDGTK